MDITTYSEDQRDCLQEICNVAMGRAADALARQYEVFIRLSIPVIKIVEGSDLAHSLSGYQGEDKIYAAAQLFSSERRGPDLSGMAMVVLSEASFADLRILAPAHLSDEDLLTQCCLVMAQTCLDALSEDWGLGFECQPPQQMSAANVGAVCQSIAADWRRLLVVEINFRMEGREYSGDLLLLFPNQAIEAMGERLDELLL